MIACTHNEGCPVIIGDLLISDSVKPQSFTLPALSDNVMDYLAPDTSHYPILLSQKVYLIKPNICAAFAGKGMAIKLFLEDLKRFCSYYEVVTQDHIKNFLEGYDQTELPSKDLSFIILVSELKNGSTDVGQFTRGTGVTGKFYNFGQFTALGSGAEAFALEIQEVGTLTSQLTPGTVDYAIQINTILISKILSKERSMLSTINKHWGAGFQLVYLNNGVFCRLDEVTYIINQGQIDEKGEFGIPIPAIVLRYKYHGEILVITAIAPDKGETETTDTQIITRYKSFQVTQFIVAPVDHRGDIDISQFGVDTSFTSVKNAMGYILETETGKYLPASFHIGKDLQVEYTHLTSVTITMQRELNDILQETVKANFSAND